MIVRYKTAYYTFYLPCAIGMIYAGVKDPASYRLARDICCRIGEFFQIQDDYLDCFGDPKVIGKVRVTSCVVYGVCVACRVAEPRAVSLVWLRVYFCAPRRVRLRGPRGRLGRLAVLTRTVG